MRFVSYINERFSPGLCALLKSLDLNSGMRQTRFTVMTEGDIPSRSKLEQLWPGIEFVGRGELGEFKSVHHIGQNRFAFNWQKLCVWLLPYDETCYFLDADMICVGNISDARRFTPFMAPIVFGISMPPSVGGRPMFSAGSFVFRPDPDFFRDLQAFADEWREPLPLAEQTLLNLVLNDNGGAKLLGIEWEMLKRVYVHHPKVWRSVVDKKFIHFVGKKPWETSEPGYEELEKLWRRYA